MTWIKQILVCTLFTTPLYAYHPKDLNRAQAGDKNLSGAQLQDAKLCNVDLSKADLTGANLNNATLDNVNLKGAKLINPKLQEITIKNCNFDNAFLSNAHFTNATIIDTKFFQARLDRVYFHKSVLRNIDFSKAKLKQACSFCRSQLDHIIMQETSLSHLFIGDCFLNNINLQEARIKETHFRMFDTDHENNSELQINRATWKNIDFRNAIIIDGWFIGHLILLFDKEYKRIPELESLEPSWFYKLSVLVNPLHAAKRMISDDYDEYNVNSAFVNSNFDGALFLGVGFTNIALKNCLGIDSLKKRRRCCFHNVVVEDTKQNQRYIISD